METTQDTIAGLSSNVKEMKVTRNRLFLIWLLLAITHDIFVLLWAVELYMYRCTHLPEHRGITWLFVISLVLLQFIAHHPLMYICIHIMSDYSATAPELHSNQWDKLMSTYDIE